MVYYIQGDEMKINFFIDKIFKEPEIRICGSELTEELKSAAEDISAALGGSIAAYDGAAAEILRTGAIVTVYSEGKRVIARTAEKTYDLKMRLYEAEVILEKHGFVRISNSEMVNMRKIIRLDTSISGTIHIYLNGGIESYVSRRYIKKIKDTVISFMEQEGQ